MKLFVTATLATVLFSMNAFAWDHSTKHLPNELPVLLKDYRAQISPDRRVSVQLTYVTEFNLINSYQLMQPGPSELDQARAVPHLKTQSLLFPSACSGDKIEGVFLELKSATPALRTYKVVSVQSSSPEPLPCPAIALGPINKTTIIPLSSLGTSGQEIRLEYTASVRNQMGFIERTVEHKVCLRTVGSTSLPTFRLIDCR